MQGDDDMDQPVRERFDTIIIGGGQNGLAVGAQLARAGHDFVILDRHPKVGDRWRATYDSLRLYTPARYDGLPGMAFPGPRQSFPTGAQMAAFLQEYAERFALPVRCGVTVDRVQRDDDGTFVVSTAGRELEAAQVVVATGPQLLPRLPALAADLDPGIRQLHSSEYRNAGQLADGPVLVVGAAHSGADIALDVAAAGHHTHLVGPHRGEIPFDIEGRPAQLILPVLWFLATHVITERTPLGRKARSDIRSHGGPLLRVRRADLTAAGVGRDEQRVTEVRGGRPVLEDGTAVDVRNVVWCTGFRRDFAWIDGLELGSDGWPEQHHGASTSIDGLYFAGLLFQFGFTSMLVGGTTRDCGRVARLVLRRAKSAKGVPSPVGAVTRG